MGTTADANYGFKGQVSSAQTPVILGKGSRYSVQGVGDLKVTIGGAGDRAITVAPGSAWGDGVLSVWAGPSGAVLNATAGTRWSTVVIRRTWTPAGTPTGTAQLMILSGGSERALSASRTTNRGVTTSDQPLALIFTQTGQTAVQQVVDLRCWAGDGGLYAVDVAAKQYLTDVGTQVRIGSTLHTRVINGSGNATWDEVVIASGEWQTGAFSSKFNNYGGVAASAPQWRDAGDSVSIRGVASPKTTAVAAEIGGVATTAVLFTLPAPYRPTREVVRLMPGGGTETWVLRVDENTGQVSASRYSGTAGTSTWMPFSLDFLRG